MSMEDLTGAYEAVLFPDAYERFAPIATRPGPFIVTGRVDAEYGSPTVNVSALELASSLPFTPKAPLLELAEAEAITGYDSW
jgi:DNA polymerase III alpha subunit